ncbi:MAG TPA: protein translocase subunit SecD [Kiritimatiellia bacterium]|nr:protein translocase subunit SecD [Kiritimatiellia bacterium]
MEKNVLWKWLLLFLMAVGSLALVTPVSEKVKLGLDLQGGISFVVAVDREDLTRMLREERRDSTPEEIEREINERIRNSQDVVVEVIRNRVDGIGIAEPSIFPRGDERVVIQLPGVDEAKQKEARDSIMSVALLEFRLVHQSSDEWVSELFAQGLAPRGFRISDAGRQLYVRDPAAVPDAAMDRAFWADMRRFAPKPRSEFMLMRRQDPVTRAVTYSPAYIETRTQLTGDALRSARVEYGTFNEPRITLEFNARGARDFAQVTRDYSPRGQRNLDNDEGRQLGIVLDGTLYSAPVLRTPILDGRAEITGAFSATEAQRLVNVLRAGSLPIPVEIIEERQVSPTLGRDSIQSGVQAAMYGAALVVLFMLVYYRVAGLVANLSLFMVMFLLPVGMYVAAGFLAIIAGGTEAGTVGLPVITMPGIAGIVLTIGMAVDAAVIIFERMREEQEAGKSVTTSIQAGYEKAFSAILDSNVTTVLTAVILFWQGSGPIRGFAVTLCAGIIISMLIALVYMRVFLNASVKLFKLEKFNMMKIVRATSFDFLGKRKMALALSAVIIAGSSVVFFQKGNANFNVDFTGGTSLIFRFADRPSTEDVRNALTGQGFVSPMIQFERDIALTGGELRELLDVRVSYEEGDSAREFMLSHFAANGLELVQTESIGPQVGEELKRSGMWAIVFAMLGIVLYLSLRFEFAFAVGAIAAVFHDVLIAIGIYCLLGKQISLPIVAALLTIVGYSVNDTIVVFDRIRENRALFKNRRFMDICNMTINQTLSRTILTSVTTLLTVTMLLWFGGGAINDFALLLFIGIIAGTYSTIFIATPVAAMWHRDEDHAAPLKDKEVAAKTGKYVKA